MRAIADSPPLQFAETDSQSPERFFEERLQQILCPGDRILDAGCGTGKFFSFTFAKEIGCHITGIDTCAELSLNPSLDARVRADITKLPFSKKSFDLVNCRLVVEHLTAPEAAFEELHRVLKPGGRLAILTPNLLHYFGMAAQATPHWFHVWFNSRVRHFPTTDLFPTYYRANTRDRLNSQLLGAGFRQVEISFVEGMPNVLGFNVVLHRMGMAYKYLVDEIESLAPFRLNIIAVAFRL